MTARERIERLRELQAKADAGRWCVELSHEALAALPALLDIAEAAMEARDHLYDKQDVQRVRAMASEALAKLEGK